MSPVSKRDAAKKQVLAAVRWWQTNHDNINLIDAQGALERLNQTFVEFNSQHELVLEATGPAEVAFQEIEANDTSNLYEKMRDDLTATIERLQQAQTTSSSSIHHAAEEADAEHQREACQTCDASHTRDSSRTRTAKQPSSPSRPLPVNQTQNAGSDDDDCSVELQRLNNVNTTIVHRIAIVIRGICNTAIRATPSNTPEAMANTQLATLGQYWTTYTTTLFADWTIDFDDDFNTLQHLYMRASANLAVADAHKQPHPSSITPSAASYTNSTKTELKLPTITIPKFSGAFNDWSSFHDLFVSMVDSNTNLTKVQKMYYLRSSVQGDAEKLIRTYKITDANYDAVWLALRERYNNRRLIINAHLDQIFDISKCTSESATAMRSKLDALTEAVRALHGLDLPTTHWDVILVHFFQSRLDQETKRAWEMSLVTDEVPTFAQLRAFVERRCRSIEGNQQATKTRFGSTDVRFAPASKPSPSHASSPKPRAFVAASTSEQYVCAICKGNHLVMSCPAFIKLQPRERYHKCRDINACFNCLRLDHRTSNCQSSHTCRKCGARHHSLLHYEEKPSSTTTNTNPVTSTTSFMAHHQGETLLATAVAFIIGINGEKHQVRILFDNGSTACFMSERCAQRIGLTRSKANIPVSGLSMVRACHTRGMAEFEISDEDDINRIPLHAFVLAQITSSLPSNIIDKQQLPFLSAVPKLADPNFNTPASIDLLIGSNVIGQFLLDGRVHSSENPALFAQNTTLGWIIAGPIPGPLSCNLHTLFSLPGQQELDSSLRRFWELESIGLADARTPEDIACELHFKKTHTRDASGRYTVALPFREQTAELGNSKKAALNSLHQLERRFTKDPSLREQYGNFINEYLHLGHMSLASHACDDHASFHLPHHAVFKPSSTSTKMRVVFNASWKTVSGVSLNDKLMVGPRLQEDLYDILIRFRMYAVVFCGDLVKMFRQIRTTAASSEYQRILWRASPDENVRTYRLDTVTYGTAPASYLSTKVLQQLAVDEAERFPLASKVATTDFYMDDLMTGCNTIKEALELQHQIIGLMNSGGFTISKWASNVNELLESVPESQREVHCPLEIHVDESIKTLGLSWNPGTDRFQYNVTTSAYEKPPTKRAVLSEISRLYDPLGLLAPLITRAKIFMQSLWAEGLDWDQPLTPYLENYWQHFRNNLVAINNITIPRWLGFHIENHHQLHGFCDASEAAYGAVIYLRSTCPNGDTAVRLITAKTKVAPTKKISVPRLELCGALLLADIFTHVKAALRLADAECFAWCDSTVCVAWIKKPSHSWQTFVANRVSSIQDQTSPSIWHHIAGAENPADAASRGLSASDLVTNKLWWQGPSWLPDTPENWPRSTVEISTTVEAKPTAVLTLGSLVSLLEKFSSFNRLRRVTAYVRRFIFNCSRSPMDRRTGSITTNELAEAERMWALRTQLMAFPEIFTAIQRGKSVSTSGPLKSQPHHRRIHGCVPQELRDLHHTVISQFRSSSLADTLAAEGTQWHFNPPGAPSFGGIWEAGVKSVKHHLRRVLGTSLLTFEEMATVLTQIEAILNSRPITPMSDDAGDQQALTPGHFLIGEPMSTVPDPTVQTPVPLNRRWQHLQAMTQHFWQRWRLDYMHTLQQRTKWTKRTDNVEAGALALIRDETLPPAKWALGRITETHPGIDGLVRVATLKIGSGFVKRPINKLCIFPKD